MLPWNYGFHFGAASYVFMGAFYTVLLVVATTFLNALWRTNRDLTKGKAEDICWHSDFHDLSAAPRAGALLDGLEQYPRTQHCLRFRKGQDHGQPNPRPPAGARRRGRS